MKLAEILTGPETWCQGAFSRRQGTQHCLVGAVQVLTRARRSMPKCQREVSRLECVIPEVTGVPWANVPWFNDHPNTKWEIVARVVEAYDRDRMLNP